MSSDAYDTRDASADPLGGAYARFYDFIVAHRDELPHLLRLSEQLAPGRPAKILECGAGTGRLAVPLAKAGHDVVGLDRSPRMFEMARARWHRALKAARERMFTVGACKLVEADFAHPPAEVVPRGTFDLVVYSSNTLALLIDEASQQAALEAAHAALRPGGALLIEQFYPPGFFHEAFRQREWYLQFTRTNPATGLLTSRSISFLHDPVQQHVWGTTLIEEFLPAEDSKGGGSRRHLFVEHLRYHHLAELRLRLQSVGFAPAQIASHGGHNDEPLTARSLKLVVLAHKAQ